MKYFYTFLILLFTTTANAQTYFLVNIDNEVVAKVNYEPSQEDLEKRNLVAIKGDRDLELKDSEYRGNKIVRRVETAQDRQEEQERKQEIDKRLQNYESAKQKLIDLGLTADEVDSLR